MTSDQLHYFLEIAALGSMSKAGQNLGVSQQTLSYSMQALEDEFSCALFVRTNRGVKLTEAGKAFQGYAQDAWHHYQSIRAELLTA